MDRSAPSITLEPSPSTPLRVALGAVALLALVALGLTALPPWALACGGAIVLAQAWLADRKLRRMASMRVALQRDGTWRSSGPAADTVLTLRDHAVIGPLVALTFDSAGSRMQRMVLVPGMVAPDALRALRVWLRHGYPPPPDRG